MAQMNESDWYTFLVCTECDRRYYGGSIIHSYICPGCATLTRGHLQRVIIKRFSPPWWQFWGKSIYVGKDKHSESWLSRQGKL